MIRQEHDRGTLVENPQPSAIWAESPRVSLHSHGRLVSRGQCRLGAKYIAPVEQSTAIWASWCMYSVVGLRRRREGKHTTHRPQYLDPHTDLALIALACTYLRALGRKVAKVANRAANTCVHFDITSCSAPPAIAWTPTTCSGPADRGAGAVMRRQVWSTRDQKAVPWDTASSATMRAAHAGDGRVQVMYGLPGFFSASGIQ